MDNYFKVMMMCQLSQQQRELDVSRQTAHERIKDYGLSLRPR